MTLNRQDRYAGSGGVYSGRRSRHACGHPANRLLLPPVRLCTSGAPAAPVVGAGRASHGLDLADKRIMPDRRRCRSTARTFGTGHGTCDHAAELVFRCTLVRVVVAADRRLPEQRRNSGGSFHLSGLAAVCPGCVPVPRADTEVSRSFE